MAIKKIKISKKKASSGKKQIIPVEMPLDKVSFLKGEEKKEIKKKEKKKNTKDDKILEGLFEARPRIKY